MSHYNRNVYLCLHNSFSAQESYSLNFLFLQTICST
nr:MAG TPA: hypothetical protein [Bacteriophage sp.]